MSNIKLIGLYALYYLITLSFIYITFVGYPIWDGFFYWLWKAVRNNHIQYGFLIFIMLEFFYTSLPVILYKRKYTQSKSNQNTNQNTNNIGLLIPCHNAQKVLPKTLQNALKIFKRENIYIIDNGNSDSPPSTETRDICVQHGVRYVWVPEGSKISSIYVGAKIMKHDFVMQIDDDVLLNEEMIFPINDETHCLAYMISASSHDGKKNMLHHLQDMEYKHSGIIKGFQSWVGSTMFAHGAISLWRRMTLIEILEKHTLYPISDDWFTGFKANELGYKIDVCDKNFSETDAPNTLFTTSRKSGYGNATLFSQRFSRWYITRFIQIIYMLYYIVCCWKLPGRRIVAQKFFFLWDIFNTLLNSSKLYIFVFYLLYDWKFTLIMYAACIGLSFLNFLVFNYNQLLSNERLPLWVMFVFPLYSTYDSFVFFISILYSIVINPAVLFHTKEKLSSNIKVNNTIKEYQSIDTC